MIFSNSIQIKKRIDNSSSLIRSLKSFTYLHEPFKAGQDPRVGTQMSNTKAEHILSFPCKRQRAKRQLAVLGDIAVRSMGAREPFGRAGSRCVGGLVNQPRQQRQGNRHTGRRAEPEWALLQGFFASPSLNESNP